MISSTNEAAAQIARVADHFSGDVGRANYDRLRLDAETMSSRFKMLAGWAARSGEDFLHEAINSCITLNQAGDCVRRIPPHIPIHFGIVRIVQSLINHAYQGRGRRLSAEMPEPKRDDTKNDTEKMIEFEPVRTMWSEGSDRLSEAEREDALARFDAFLAFARPDKIVHGMLLLIKNEGIDKPASLIAERLGISEIEVFQARRRLASAVGRYLKQLEAA